MQILLFLATNAAVLVVVSVVFQLLGLEGILQQNGVDLNLSALLVMSAVIGVSGSLISLVISKWSAKRSMGVQIIEQPASSAERWLIDTVSRQAQQAGIGMPEVGVFDSAQPNAFATGMSRNNALVAVSTGLLRQMNQDEVEAVLAHEVSHVKNGDMVTMGLVQGVVNTFVIFLSRIVGHLVDRTVFKTERGHGPGFFITSLVAQLILGVLASAIVMWFSRWREFRSGRPVGTQQDDRRPAPAAIGARAKGSAGRVRGLRHRGRFGGWHQEAVPEPPTAGRADRRPRIHALV